MFLLFDPLLLSQDFQWHNILYKFDKDKHDQQIHEIVEVTSTDYTGSANNSPTT
jgi:hypothetical protein